MSKTIIKYITLVILVLAGIVLTPACSYIDENPTLDSSKNGVIATATPSDSQGGVVTNPTDVAIQPTQGAIQVITTNEELEEYFDSITDAEIEELFRIIEDIDISTDIDPEADPGFDQVVIP